MIVLTRGEPGTVRVLDGNGEPSGTVFRTRDWPRFQKVVPTCALRMDGPFRVETSEGPLTCQDGYLCVDARDRKSVV